ncbi:MAG: methyltransferase domain-containing protein [Candidatus Omnitrophica bacterium]|nr:methyltransferase domain-containing protein [Candidatus Omnitrophota bacterium]
MKHARNEKERVREYWDRKPLFTSEIDRCDLVQYFREVDRLKREEIEVFALAFWEFDKHRGEDVLDLGCGPGWLTVQYASHGAGATALDLSQSSLAMTRDILKDQGLEAALVNADCEHLPFESNRFDFVSASGVLHHTPDTRAGVGELFRVLKPGGRAAVSLYYQNALLSPALFPMTRLVLKLLGIKKPDARLGRAGSVEELGALYDGEGNPYGRIYSRRSAMDLFSGFKFDPARDVEIHYFPKRFLPFGHWIRGRLFKWLDHACGTMIYLKLTKPAGASDERA